MHQGDVLPKPSVPAASHPLLSLLFILLIAFVLFYIGRSLIQDLSGIQATPVFTYVLLGVALLVALSFEFVNGFHDAANAVATVIYTHSLPARTAVVWSGFWNFLGVLSSSGAVAFSVVSLLPVELILQVGSSAGFAMVFALLFAAMIWNVGTWLLGLPTSSSHTLIGSIIGVGLMNQILQGHTQTTGVDWSQASKVGYALLVSPLVGFVGAALLFFVAKSVLRNPALYRSPEGQQPPPFGTRAVLILTCTGVSFAHGSNDGQKGMGLIMLILIGTFPAAYALDKTVSVEEAQAFVVTSDRTISALTAHGTNRPASSVAEAREEVLDYLRSGLVRPATIPAVSTLMQVVAGAVARYGSYANVAAEMKGQIRNDMDLIGDALDALESRGKIRLVSEQQDTLNTYREELDRASKFIPVWVKVAVAFALGLGTMVGWRRIVVTVGERIGKTHLTYAQGATAETVALSTIIAADLYGVPVSTTHVLSSAVAGTMVANHSGLQVGTVRNILVAWVLTLPVSCVLAAGLYWIMRHGG